MDNDRRLWTLRGTVLVLMVMYVSPTLVRLTVHRFYMNTYYRVSISYMSIHCTVYTVH